MSGSGVGEAWAADNRPLVIAHRGASGYLPEHTLAAKALAYAMGADYIEQDVVLTQDDVPVVLHDIHIDTVTNVQQVFPHRKRPDGRYYAIDFTIAELQQLSVHERVSPTTGKAVFPQRFPVGKSSFRIPTLAEEIELIQGLNRSTQRQVGIYPEIKKPAWHRQQGKDISRIVLKVLQQYGYKTKQDACYLQCFDAKETQRLREDLGCRLRLVQLIGENTWKESTTDYDSLRSRAGLTKIATYADGIGPAVHHVVTGVDNRGTAQLTRLVADAHAAGLQVHPYTLRADALPAFLDDDQDLLRILVVDAQVDGLFSDFPDTTARQVRALLRQ